MLCQLFQIPGHTELMKSADSLHGVINMAGPQICPFTAFYIWQLPLVGKNTLKNKIKNDNIFLGTVIGAGIISSFEALQAIGLKLSFLDSLFSNLPFDSLGLAWVCPAILTGIIFKFIPKK